MLIVHLSNGPKAKARIILAQPDAFKLTERPRLILLYWKWPWSISRAAGCSNATANSHARGLWLLLLLKIRTAAYMAGNSTANRSQVVHKYGVALWVNGSKHQILPTDVRALELQQLAQVLCTTLLVSLEKFLLRAWNPGLQGRLLPSRPR